MRLNPKEKSAIQNAFKGVFPGKKYQLYLFGSRTDDKKKGGDIDLLVIVDSELRNTFIEAKSAIRKKIFEIIPEQKIDITVATNRELKTDPFLASVLPQAILI